MLALEIEPHFAEEAKKREQAGKGADGSGGRGNKKNPVENVPQGLKSRDQAAAVGVSGKLVSAAKAIESYQQALRIDPENSAAWYNLGAAYTYLGQRSKVIEIYQRLKGLDANWADKFFSNFVMP